MLLRGAVTFCALAASGIAFDIAQVFADDHPSRRVNLRELQRGNRIEIATTDRVYRGEVLNPITGETSMSASWDGVNFTAPRTVYLLGATQGKQASAGGLMLVKMHELQPGLRMELGVGSLDASDRHVTELVKTVRVE